MNKELATCYSTVADNSILQEVHGINGDDSDDLVCNIAVSCDGTWQKRGLFLAQFCPKTVSSWCKYQNDIINGATTYKNKLGIHTSYEIL